MLLRAREAGLDVLDAHSHPGDGRARFSAIDDDNEATVAAYVSKRIPGMWYGALVFTANDVEARLWCADSLGVTVVPIERLVVGGAPGQPMQILRPGAGAAPDAEGAPLPAPRPPESRARVQPGPPSPGRCWRWAGPASRASLERG